MGKALSIIIVNWNTAAYLQKCLESIYASGIVRTFEVIVVDNHSSEDISFIKELFPEIRLVICDYNYGFAVGNNIGYRLSAGEFLMTLNPDTLVYPGSVERLLEVLDSDPETAVAVPVLKDAVVDRSAYAFSSLFFDLAILRRLRSVVRGPGVSEQPFEVELIAGTGYVCRRSALSEDRIFSEDDFLFGEEYELCREVHEKGFRVKVVPSARIEHFTSVTFKSDPERLAAASRLGAAVSWKVRRRHWGNIAGTLGSAMLTAEFAFKLMASGAAHAIGAGDQERAKRISAQSRAIMSTFWPMLADEGAFLSRVNRESAAFFNGGAEPVHPPVYREIGV